MAFRVTPRKFAATVALTAALLASGCSYMPWHGHGDSEDSAEKTEKSEKPSAAAMAAHEMPASGENMNFRLLNLERQMAGLQNDMDQLLPPLAEAAPAGGKLDATIAAIQARRKQASSGEPAPLAMPPSSGLTASETTNVPPMPDSAPLSVAPPPPSMVPDMGGQPQSLQNADAAPPPAQPVPPGTIQMAPETPPSATSVPPQATQAAPALSPPPQAAASGAAITAVRIGEHPDKVRIVLDASAPLKFTTDLDAKENILMVELPGAAWSAAAQKTLSKNSLVKSYSAQPSASGSGTTLAITLAKPAKLTYSAAIGPAAPYGDRIVIDLAPQ